MGYVNSVWDDSGSSRYPAPPRCAHNIDQIAAFEFVQWPDPSIGNVGQNPRGFFTPWYKIGFKTITDGMSQTLMLGELQRLMGEHCGEISHDGWAPAGVNNLFNTQWGTINDGEYESPGSEHPGGANFAMGDASVRFLSDDISSKTLKLLSSIKGNDIVSEEY